MCIAQRGHVNSFAGNYAAARADYDSAIAIGRGNEKAAFVPFRAYVNIHAGDPKAAIAELNQLVAGVDARGVPSALGVKIGALTEQAGASGSAAFQRNAEANIASFNGWLAARKGDYAAAGQAADRVAALVAS